MQPALFLLVLERAHDQIADDARHAGHALGEFPGGGDSQSGLLEKRREQLGDLLLALGQRLELALGVQFGQPRDEPLLAADEPAELQIVGENPVWQAVAVADELLAVRAFPALHFVEIRADVLGLDVTERHAFADDLKVGAAAKDSLRLIRGRDVLSDRLQQGFQGGAVRMLGRIAGRMFLPNCSQVVGIGVHGTQSSRPIDMRQPCLARPALWRSRTPRILVSMLRAGTRRCTNSPP